MFSRKPTRLSVSVIIPTYNRAEFIKAAIDSALNQTCVPDEIIVVDDGSTDMTDRILDQYGPPVKVIRQENRGRSAARNVGLRHVTSDAVMFLDSDDLLMPTNIERCVETLDRHPEVGVVYTDSYLIDAEGKTIGLSSTIMPSHTPSGSVLGELARRCFLTVSSMVRQSVLTDIFFEDGREYCEDYDLWRRLAVRCHFQYVDEPLMCYRFHDSMTITTKLVETLEAELEVQQRIMDMREFKDLPRGERARAFCSHGAKNALLGKTTVARRYFVQAIRASIIYPGGYLLAILSLFGTRFLQFAILKRRQVIGNAFGARFGTEALSRQQAASRADWSPVEASADADAVSEENFSSG